MIMSWTEQETMRLVTMISEYPALYDPRDMSFMDGAMKDSIWSGIGQKLNKSTVDLKRTWRNLKDAFMRYRKIHKTTGKQARGVNCNIYKLMSFLEDIVDGGSYRKKTPINSLTADHPTPALNNMKPSHAEIKTTALKMIPSEDPLIVGIEHVMFNKPVEIFRHSRDGNNFINCSKSYHWQTTSIANNKRTDYELSNNNKTSIENLKCNNLIQPVKRPSRMTDSSTESQMNDSGEEDKIELIIPFPPFKIKRRRFSNERNCNKPVGNGISDVTNSDSVANIKVSDVTSHNNVKEEKNSVNNMDIKEEVIAEEDLLDQRITNLVTNIAEVLRKLPPLLRVQTMQEMLTIIAKYKMMSSELEEIDNAYSDRSSTEKSTSEVHDAEIKTESNLYDNLIEVKEEPIPD